MGTNSKDKILIIEDEPGILMGLEDDLTLEGYAVVSARDGETGLALAQEHAFSMVILDIMLPRMNGFEVCRKIRDHGVTVPILILTAKGQEADKVLGLELGADDYVTKPFSPRELQARIKAILRRVHRTREGGKLVRFGSIEVDFQRYEVRKRGVPLYCTSLEFSLLKMFLANPHRALDRDRILDEVWGKDVFVSHRTVDTHIAHLRKKIEDDPANPVHIVGVRSVGYRFEP